MPEEGQGGPELVAVQLQLLPERYLLSNLYELQSGQSFRPRGWIVAAARPRRTGPQPELFNRMPTPCAYRGRPVNPGQ